MTLPPLSKTKRLAFTLVELITVIAIIAILMALLLPAVNTVRKQANNAKAKSDVQTIVAALKSFNTDYGQYPPPISPALSGTSDVVVGPGLTYSNYQLIDVLRAASSGASSWNFNNVANPRQVVYLDMPNAKSATAPKGGVATAAVASFNGKAVNIGDLMDPFGVAYFIAIDYNYNNVIDPAANWPYTDIGPTTSTPLRAGVVAWSLGADNAAGKSGALAGSDDIVSWQ